MFSDILSENKSFLEEGINAYRESLLEHPKEALEEANHIVERMAQLKFKLDAAAFKNANDFDFSYTKNFTKNEKN